MTKRLTAQTVEIKQTTAGDGVKLVNNSLAWTERHLTHTLWGVRQSLCAPIIFFCSLVNLSPWYPPCFTAATLCRFFFVLFNISGWQKQVTSITAPTGRTVWRQTPTNTFVVVFSQISGVYVASIIGVCWCWLGFVFTQLTMFAFVRVCWGQCE